MWRIKKIHISAKIQLLFFCLVSMIGNAQVQKDTIEVSNKNMTTLFDTIEVKSRSVPKQLSPYDKNSIGKALNPMMPDRRDVSKFKVLDQGQYSISYAFNAGNISDFKTYDDMQRLEIGEKYVKYYSAFVYEADSTATAEMVEMNKAYNMNYNMDDGGIAMSINGKHQGWSRYLFSEFFKDLSTNKITEYCRMPGELKKYDSYYSESVPSQNWQIEDEIQEIAGYPCQKATCIFRGRNYTAWFAFDIPLSYGPWKFGGLPGLILKVYDDKKEYSFECINVTQHEFPIIILDSYRSYRKINRASLDKTLRRICENYYQITGMTNVVNNKLNKYNPIELE